MNQNLETRPNKGRNVKGMLGGLCFEGWLQQCGKTSVTHLIITIEMRGHVSGHVRNLVGPRSWRGRGKGIELEGLIWTIFKDNDLIQTQVE